MLLVFKIVIIKIYQKSIKISTVIHLKIYWVNIIYLLFNHQTDYWLFLLRMAYGEVNLCFNI